jgi:hypothetical protein
MQKLRSIHLYLGCIFAPMLLFFAISGIWQTYAPAYPHSKALAWLSTIHTSRVLKTAGGTGTLSSSVLQGFVLVMATSFIVTTILGIVMALNFGRSRRAAFCCLALGVLFPAVVILITAFR